jgi:tetratricopeptide (TPR) repeat protein
MTPRIHSLLLALMACLMATPAIANKPQNITKAEMALIPTYCPDTMGFGYGDAHYNTSPRAPRWVSMLGKDFWHLHHYCWALINLNRANRHGIPKLQRKGLLESVMSDYQYVLNRADPEFLLLPEILTRAGEAELMLARPERAGEAFARARQLKPDYWPAYSHWIEYLIGKGRRGEAKELAQEGLEISPSSKTLQEQYRLLGGNPALIVPRPPPASPETTEAAPPATTSAD